MPSTYTSNNGIELIATGEQSGTWGDTTNTNLSLLDTSLDGQVTITLASAGNSGSPNTLDIQDGTASNGRNRMVIFNDGSDLGATAYVQLTPNDAEKIMYIRNSLSASRSIIVFQGTYNASNDYEIPSGTTAVIYFDGAGSGAVAANVFNNAYFDSLRLGSISVTAILDEDNMASDSATALATQQSIKAYVDSQVTAQDLDFAGDSGTGAVDLDSQSLTISGTANEIETSASGQTLTVGLPDNVTITGDLTVDTNTLAVDSTNNRVGIGTASPSYTLDVSSSGDAQMRLVSSTTGSGDHTFFRNQIGGSSASNYIYFGDASDLDVGLIQYNHGSDYMRFYTNAAERLRIDSSGNVGIGTTLQANRLEVEGAVVAQGAVDSYTNDGLYLSNEGSSVFEIGAWRSGANASNLTFATDSGSDAAPVERMRITSAGNVGIGISSPSIPLHVYRSSGTSQLTVSSGGSLGTDVGTIQAYAGSYYVQNVSYGTGTTYTTTNGSAYIIGVASGSGTVRIYSAAAERVRIDSSGNMGVGTNSPVKRLTISGASNGNITTLTDGATITPNLDDSDMFTVTLGGNRTLANPSNIDAGQTGSIFIVQDGTGSRTLAFGSYWDFAGGTAPTLSTTASAVDRIDFIVRSSTSIHAVFTANYS